MITNAGKNIIAKYLVGDATAYASYIALGCGPRPRPNITTKSGVTTGTLSGNILSADPTTQINNISSTAGLFVGMTLTKTAGTGAFGGTTGTTVIKSIDSISQITVLSTAANTLGTITFNTGSVASLMSVSSTSGLWVGAKVTIISGTGTLDTLTDTIVTAISSDTSFTIAPAPVVNLSSATLALEVNPNIKALDFEMFRVPISSRGYVNDNGTNKIVLTAQLPTEERYEISEIGIYSAGSNSSAGQYDSRAISAFSGDENWLLSVSNSLSGPSTTNPLFTEIQTSIINGLNFITTTSPAIKTSTTNGIFSNPTRAARYERPRYLSNVFLLRGDTSYIHSTNGNLVTAGTPSYLQLSGQTIDLTKNSSSDLMKLTFSIVSVDGNSSDVPDTARIIVEFSDTSRTNYAQMHVEAKDSVYRFATNRYVSVSKRLDELFYTSGEFNWKSVDVLRAYVSTVDNIFVTTKESSGGSAILETASSHGIAVGNYVTIYGVGNGFDGTFQVTDVPTNTSFKYAKTGTVASTPVTPNGIVEVPNENFYVALDALRVDNISTINPLYGLVGYSIVQNSDQLTITKSPNTNNYIEYRFILDVT